MIIQAIKNLVSGKKGKQAAVIIAVAVADGYINKPTFDILKEAVRKGVDRNRYLEIVNQ